MKNKNRLTLLYQRYYPELVRRASNQLRDDRGVDISAATIVHEAWIRMSHRPQVADTSTDHFFCIVARQMRQIRIDAHRRQRAQRRRGIRAVLDESRMPGSAEVRYYDIESLLRELGELAPRLEPAVQLHFGAGYTVAEVATALGVSKSSIDRDLRFVRAWLRTRLQT